MAHLIETMAYANETQSIFGVGHYRCFLQGR